MSNTLVRRITVGAAVVLVATLGACSGGDDSPEADPSASSSAEGTDRTAFTPEDVAEPGEDMLDRARVGVEFTGFPLRPTVRFPENFEQSAAQPDRAYSDDGSLRITMKASRGDGTGEVAAMQEAQRQAKAKGQSTVLDTVTVADREFTVLVQDTPEVGIIAYAHAPEGSEEFYTLQLASDVNLADVPQEQIDAFLQTVASLELEPA